MNISYYIVAIFLFEGVLGKTSVPGFSMSISMHLGITGVLIILIAFYSFHINLKNYSFKSNPKYRYIQNSLLILVVVGLLSSVFQLNSAQNLLFWALWASNIYLIWWILPRLLRKYSVEKLMNLVILLLSISAIAGLIFPGMVQGRVGGIYGNPTTQARMLVLLYILMFSAFLSRNNLTKTTLSMGALSVPMLFMTGTRASIFAVAYTTVLMACIVLLIKNAQRIKGRAARFIVVLFIASTVALTYIVVYENIDTVYQHLRIDTSLDDIYESSRAMNWRAAMRDFPGYGLLGWGFLSKFGITDQYVMEGFRLPSYDWTNPNDPLHMLLTAAKQLGWLGLIVFSLFIAALWNAAIRHKVNYNRYVAMSVLFVGMVWGLADGNWLTTFGDPVDRISMFILAIVLHRNSEPVGGVRK